ncbi:MAG: hypothetical protein FJ029_03020 [Actinobacteria bacterium]|nr:hypothetical protein [Actinomycetota bacterium]
MRPRARWSSVFLFLTLTFAVVACGFVGSEPISAWDPPGFFHGVWHGLLAPWTLIVRFFLPIKMYAVPNSGWFYDCGFLIGVFSSIPVGWMAAIIAILIHLGR